MKADQQMETGERQELGASETTSRWRSASISLLITLFAILVLYRETAYSMVAIWARSDTFTHGFLVPLMSLWLIWRVREHVRSLSPQPCYWILPLMAGLGFFWLLGEMANVGVLSQFAFTAMLVLSVPALLGLDVAKALAFPLGFLFFAVPFGEFALPQLMEWTANAAILGLRLSGIPVYREGLHFIIPSGSWSVVEACSGVRYLIASLMVGTLFAYLTYSSVKRRLIFVGVSVLVPIVANWLRAYMIVMLGHLSGNKLAVGVDHLIYGWLFFGIVIMIMFWIGVRWREDDESITVQPVRQDPRQNNQGSQGWLKAAIPALILVVVWPLAEWQIERHAKPEVTAIRAIEPGRGWQSLPGDLADWTPRFEKPSAYMNNAYAKNDRKVGLYVAFYRNQGAERKLVTSTNVLVRSNDPFWKRTAGGSRSLGVDGNTINVRTVELSGADASKLVVWQWYWINGRLTASDALAKAYTALNRLVGLGDDSAVIILYTHKQEREATEAVLQDFVASHASAIERTLQQVRDGKD
ncbi:MAG: exosortase A [Propionivibrio sp.]